MQHPTQHGPLYERVVAHIADVRGLDAAAVRAAASLRDLGVDSLGAVALVADFEDMFDVTIPNEEVLVIRDLGGIVACLERHVPGGVPGGAPLPPA